MKQQFARAASTLGLGLVLLTTGACVSMGANFDPAQVALLQPGDTTDEVIARLGKPTTVLTTADGNVMMMWMYSQGNALGQGKGRSVTLQFTRDGRLNKVLSQSATEIGMR